MESTDRLSLPLIVPGQAQKELFHNEALEILDSLVAGAVEDLPADVPPQSPSPGECYLVGDAPSAEWAQYPAHIAAYTTAGWRFIAPKPGLSVLIKSTATEAAYNSAGWEIGTVRASRVIVDDVQVVGSQAAAIAGPAGGATVDTEARATVAAMLSALRQHGLIST